MSQGIAVAGTVASQLSSEHRWPPNNLNKVMGDDYHYDVNTISNFLVAVRWHLAYGSPRYYFEFDRNFAEDALDLTVAELTGSVNANTSDRPPNNWIAP